MIQQQLIQELRQLKEEKGYTFQDIVDMTEANGEGVSLSTVKKVFSDKCTHNHDYEHTLRPIAEALSPESEDETLNEAIFRTRLQIKEEIIRGLKERLEAKELKWKDREEFLKEQLLFYRQQIHFKDEQIKLLNERIDRRDELLRKFFIGNGKKD